MNDTLTAFSTATRDAGSGGQLNLLPLASRVEERRTALGLSQAKVADQIKPKMSASLYNQWIHGKYRGPTDEIERLATAWLDRQDMAAAAMTIVDRDIDWIRLDISEQIWTAFEYAYVYNDFNVVYGNPGLSKSMTAREYASQHGTWMVTLSEVTGGITSGLEEIAEALGLKLEWSQSFRRRATKEIRAKLKSSNRMLIIDEAQFASKALVEEIRSIWDFAQVGIVLVGNEKVHNQMTGGNQRAAFAQVRSRIAMSVRPKAPTDADVRKVANAWGVTSESAVKFCIALVRKQASGGLRDVSYTLRLAIADRGEPSEVNEADLRRAWKNRGMEAA